MKKYKYTNKGGPFNTLEDWISSHPHDTAIKIHKSEDGNIRLIKGRPPEDVDYVILYPEDKK